MTSEIFMERPDLHPAYFAENELGLKPYPKHVLVLDSVALNKRTAFKAANGGGKTSQVLTDVVIWAMSKFAGCKIVVTSGSWEQIDSQILPNIRSHAEKLPGWVINDGDITAPNGSVCYFISTIQPGRFEGHHGTEDKPLFIIVDEAKTVPEPIFSAIARCTYQRLLLLSSPGLQRGTFFDAFDKPELGFACFSITADECPHLTEDHKRYFIAKYGANHPITRSALNAEFMGDDDVTAASKPVKGQHVTRCYNTKAPIRNEGRKTAFLDFAAGGDENVIAALFDTDFAPLVTWAERDTMAACGRFIIELRRLGFKPHEVWGDEGGVGRAMCDALNEAGWPINRVNNGEKPHDPAYVNLGAEIWFEGGKAIEHCEYNLPPDPDGILKKQLTDRGGTVTSDGRLKLESKEDMRKRGVGSPDRADGVLGAIWAHKRPTGPIDYTKNHGSGADQFSDLMDDFNSSPESAGMAGAFAGD